jgi:6-phosphofructokinase 1
MMIVAEGDEEGGAAILYDRLKQADCPFPMRVLILGHLQRGGTPTPEDRILACQTGDGAVRAILSGADGVMIGVVNGHCVQTKFEDTYRNHRPIPGELLALVETMAH